MMWGFITGNRIPCTWHCVWECIEYFKIYFIEEYSPLCELTKMVFLHLKIVSKWRIYTSMRVFFKICFCKLTIIVFLTLEYLNIFSTRRIYSSVQVDKTYVFYLMNIHLCASWWKWSWIVPLTYTWALWVEWWGITKCPLFMAVQVHKNQADELGNVYSKGERLLCRIWLCRETHSYPAQ